MIRQTLAAALAAAATFLSTAAPAGDLDPPGPPAPTQAEGQDPRLVINAENTPGDSDSLYRITASGSYRLADNILVLSSTASSAIEIAASDVTIDLGGFEVARFFLPIPFTGEPRGALAAVAGIRASPDVTGITIINGHVNGWSGEGIDLREVDDCSVRNVTARNNVGHGIEVGVNGTVIDCTARGNGGSGIETSAFGSVRGCIVRDNMFGITCGPWSLVSDCVVANNGQWGVRAGGGGLVSRVVSTGNGEAGITLTGGGHISHCTATGNQGRGISGGAGSHIESCRANGNGLSGIWHSRDGVISGCSSADNGVHGIEISVGTASVVGNSCSSNVQAGISVEGNGARIEGNFVTGNGTGILVVGIDNLIAKNTARGNDDEYSETGTNEMANVRINVNDAGPWDNLDL